MSRLWKAPDPRRMPPMSDPVLLSILFFLAAVLYSSVGHAGASGYLAAMAFVGMAPASMKPTALTLNILVAILATWRFARAGCFSWPILWPFMLGSIPLSFVGGAIHLPGWIFKPLVGAVLCYAAARLVWTAHREPASPHKTPPVPTAIAWGGVIGLLSGLTGTGGGIFLSPLLLFMGWAEARASAGVAAAFILVNSIAGLAGNIASVGSLPPHIPLYAGVVIVGALIGTELGSRRLAPQAIKYLLALVLLVAGLKMMLT